MKTICCILVFAISAVPAFAATTRHTAPCAYSGDGSSASCAAGTGQPGAFNTIQACANAAVAGDTCTVYAGTYAGWTQTTSGSAGNPITFTVNPDDTVTITSTVTVLNTSYITIGAPDAGGGCAANATTVNGNQVGGCFIFSNAGILGGGSSTPTTHLHVTYNKASGSGPGLFTPPVFVKIPSNGDASSNSTDNIFAHNWGAWTPTAPFCSNFYEVRGDRNLFEYNDVTGTGDDFADIAGANVVVRGNVFHDLDQNITLGCSQSPEHADFVQVVGVGTSGDPVLSFSLIEGNKEQNCSNDADNCNFFIVRTGVSAPTPADTIIVRYNFAQNLDGDGGGYGGGSDDNVPNGRFYNNTIATETLGYAANAACISFWPSPNAINGKALNNICYNTTPNGWSPTGAYLSSMYGNGNLAYNTSCTTGCTWGSPTSTLYVNEPTYASLHNQNPLFANYPADDSLQSGSPAINAGVALTTVTSGCGSSSLVVADAHFFQPGWGPSDHKVQGDWIRVGSSATAQISDINYATNTLTLASSLSCSVGDPVWLYSDSTGRRVLVGSAPNIGAGFVEATPAPPTGLTAVSQ